MSESVTADRDRLLRRGIRLEVLTISWNVVEAVIAIGAGAVASSIALIGFGLDSVIEVVAAVVVLHRLLLEARVRQQQAATAATVAAEPGGDAGSGCCNHTAIDACEADEITSAAETRALQVVGFTFFALAAYILFEAGTTLWHREAPAESPVGIGLATASLIVMPILAWWKHRTGIALGSQALVADAKETYACSLLSVILLVGLGLHSLTGIWWFDPIAALAMVPWLVKEGREAWAGETCCGDD